MRRESLKEPFDPKPFHPALALIRIPENPQTKANQPGANDYFGTGFFVTTNGVLLTVAHNLTEDGEPNGPPLPWVWICSYDSRVRDWTNIHRVPVDAKLLAPNLDAAVLRVPFTVLVPLRVSADWQRGDNVVILGFQPNSSKLSGFTARWQMCEIPIGWDVAPFDLQDSDEPSLRLGIVHRGQPLGKGMSGGPVLNCECEGFSVIAIEKAEEYPDPSELRPPEIKTSAVHWMRHLFVTLPETRDLTWLPRQRHLLEPRIIHPLRPARYFQERPELAPIRSFWKDRTDGGVLSVVGIGGAGKTSLVERFLCEVPDSSIESKQIQKRKELPRPEGLFVWSFYESPTCDEFLEQFAEYLCGDGNDSRDPQRSLSQIQRAADVRKDSRILVVLDGLERLQSDHYPFLGQIRADSLPLRQFLRWVAGARAIWLIVTTRLPLSDLAGWMGKGCERVNVDQLGRESARFLLRACGVQGTDEELDELINEFSRHALTLAHLGGLLRKFYGGDPLRARELPPLEDIGGDVVLDDQARRLARILAGYEQLLSAESVSVLKALSALRVPSDPDTIAGIFGHYAAVRGPDTVAPLPSRPYLLQELSRLVDLGLLQTDDVVNEKPRYSVHPAVAQYFYRALQEDAVLVHQGARTYLARQVGVGDFRVSVRGAVRTRGAAPLRGRGDERQGPRDRAILDLLEEAIYHGLKAGAADEAYRLYRDNLGGYEHLGWRLKDYTRGLRILGMFLPLAETAPSKGYGWLKDVREDYDKFKQEAEGS